VKFYLCIKDYWSETKEQYIYIRGGLYMFEDDPMVYFNEHFIEYQMIVRPE